MNSQEMAPGKKPYGQPVARHYQTMSELACNQPELVVPAMALVARASGSDAAAHEREIPVPD